MSQHSARKVLLDIVSEKITSIKTKCKRNKSKYQSLTAASILLSGAITFTLGFDLPSHTSAQKNVALLLGLFLTLINGWMAMFDYKKLWMRQKATLFGLYQLESELKFLSDNEQDQTKVQLLFNSYQAVWEKDGNEWVSIHSTPAEGSN